ncbi:hypothetical protein HD806DRAFT_544175 [Xylariaceae sp. AK1471]|nr:hypothetical protein HD806DRAFT_544175 [Xylariaceae sp. AK1471]
MAFVHFDRFLAKRMFQKLYEDHYEGVMEVRTFLYSTLGNDKEGQGKKKDLKDISDAGRIMKVVAESSSRKIRDCSLSDSSTTRIKSDLTTVRNSIALALNAIAPPSTNSSDRKGEKRSSGDKIDEPPSKKSKMQINAGDCKEFDNVIRDYKKYLAAPGDAPGTKEHRDRMIENLLLTSEWNFSDRTSNARPPSFNNPCIGESLWRNGTPATRGFNEFKKVLGGGLTPEEASIRDNPYLAKTLSLRGGASGDGDKNKKKRMVARQRTQLRFRDPNDLWNEFYDRVKEDRPPMMDPNRVGDPMLKYRKVMEKIPKPMEWESIENETDLIKLQNLATGYLQNVSESRQEARDFICSNPRIKGNAPKLHEEGGQDKRKHRYEGLRDRHFTKPIGHAFEARMYQIFRLAIYWKLYLLGAASLQDILLEEKRNLEWENNRWFSLKDEFEIEDCRKRYDARSLLRQTWARERESADRYNFAFGNVLRPDGFITPGSTLSPTRPQRQNKSYGSRGGAVKTGVSGHQSQTNAKNSGLENQQDDIEMGDSGDGDDNADFNNNNNNSGDNDDDNSNSGENNDDDNDIAGHDVALAYFQKTRDVYEKKLNEEIRKNNALDADDPGNRNIINRNNINIMSLQQTIWSLDTEIHNLRRSLEPLAAGNYGRGAQHRWELPEDESYWRYTRKIPKKKPLPLGVTSLNLGPMPGEHPTPGHPRVLVGAGPGFGAAPRPGQEAAEPEDDGLFDGLFNPQTGKQERDPQQEEMKAGVKIPLQIDEIPTDWPQLIQLHDDSQKKTEQTGMAALGWDEWTESVYRAVRNDTNGFKDVFPDQSPFKMSDESLRRYVNSLYRQQFKNSSFEHNAMSWRERETRRHEILETLSKDVNNVLENNKNPAIFARPGPLQVNTVSVNNNNPAPFARPGPSDPAPTSTAQDTSTDITAEETVLERLEELIRKKNIVDAKIRLLRRRKKNAKSLSEWETRLLANAEKRRKEYIALYKSVRNEADAATRAQADLLYQQKNDKFEAAAKIVDEGEDKAHKEAQAKMDEMVRKAQDAKDRAAGAAMGGDKQAKKKKANQHSAQDTAQQHAQKLIERLREEIKEATSKYDRNQLILDNATENAEMAVATAKAKPSASAQKAVDEAEKWRDIAYQKAAAADIDLQLLEEELHVQQEWNNPAWSASELQATYDNLDQDIDLWKSSYPWEEGRDTVEYVHQQWAISVIKMMHEAMKAQNNTRMESPYFPQMYEHFWVQMPGDTLEKKRKIWLHTLITTLHLEAEKPNSSITPLIKLPPQPPAEWYNKTPTKEKLLEQAQNTRAQKTKLPQEKTNTNTNTNTNKKPPQIETNTNTNTKTKTKTTTTTKPPEIKRKSAPPAVTYVTPPTTLVSGINKSDAWPDLKGLLQATWSAVLAYNALQQQPGDTMGLAGQPGWPAPVSVKNQQYVDL